MKAKIRNSFQLWLFLKISLKVRCFWKLRCRYYLPKNLPVLKRLSGLTQNRLDFQKEREKSTGEQYECFPFYAPYN